MARRYVVAEHPRLEVICRSHVPVRFAAEDPTPDPFDVLIAAEGGAVARFHACLGRPLSGDGSYVDLEDASHAFDPPLWSGEAAVVADPRAVCTAKGKKHTSAVLIPHAVRAVAGLYRLFWMETHPEGP
jgi:hypothetical protein